MKRALFFFGETADVVLKPRFGDVVVANKYRSSRITFTENKEAASASKKP